ncbi:hypothetical protein IFM47457_07672 [Aspergillus lentulus]|nr:hypothetical protein IFM47457_07672 [Aspergillus lentulus]
MPRKLFWLTGSDSKAGDATSSPRRLEVKHEKDSDHSAEKTPKNLLSYVSRRQARFSSVL